MKTKQELFDFAVNHMDMQRLPSIKRVEECGSDSVSCVYRGENGRMCIVGAMIKDEFYSPKMESKVADNEMVIHALKCSGVIIESFDDIAFIRHLQLVHDVWADYYDRGRVDLQDLKGRFDNFAMRYKLDTGVLDGKFENV